MHMHWWMRANTVQVKSLAILAHNKTGLYINAQSVQSLLLSANVSNAYPLKQYTGLNISCSSSGLIWPMFATEVAPTDTYKSLCAPCVSARVNSFD